MHPLQLLHSRIARARQPGEWLRQHRDFNARTVVWLLQTRSVARMALGLRVALQAPAPCCRQPFDVRQWPRTGTRAQRQPPRSARWFSTTPCQALLQPRPRWARPRVVRLAARPRAVRAAP